MKIYIAINLIFAMIFGFGTISRGRLKHIIIFMGGVGIFIISLVSFIVLGLVQGLLVLLATIFLLMPLAGFVMGLVNTRGTMKKVTSRPSDAIYPMESRFMFSEKEFDFQSNR